MPTPIHTIINEVCRAFDRTRDEVLGDSRVKENVEPRILAMALARDLTKASFPAIGRIFSRDQSTVQSACKREKVLRERNHDFAIRREAVLRALHPEGRDPQ